MFNIRISDGEQIMTNRNQLLVSNTKIVNDYIIMYKYIFVRNIENVVKLY